MKKKSNKEKESEKSLFTDLDTNIKREHQVYINEEIMEAVLDAKKQSAKTDDENTKNHVFSTIQKTESNADSISEDISIDDTVSDNIIDENQRVQSGVEPHPDDLDIYDSLFSETTIVSTQIYTYEIDKNLGGDNFSSNCSYRVGQDISDIGSIFTVTRKELKSPLNISRTHSNSDLNWYNDLAGLGFSYAAVCGTTVQGIIICEPQYWNNTLFIRHFMVGKKYRNHGIGKSLIQECTNRAHAEGFRALTLEVTSSNGAAIDFYRHMNFNIVGMNVSLYSNSDILKEDVGIFMHKVII